MMRTDEGIHNKWKLHRPSTDDDGVKHCSALLKIASKRVPEGIQYATCAKIWELIFPAEF